MGRGAAGAPGGKGAEHCVAALRGKRGNCLGWVCCGCAVEAWARVGCILTRAR